LLTSGGANNVGEGLERLKELQQEAGSISLVAGGGVRGVVEVEAVLKETGITQVHGSFSYICSSARTTDNAIPLGKMPEQQVLLASTDVIKSIKKLG
jgi:copper homeostasis protein CutC